MKLWDLEQTRLELVKGRSCVATSMEHLMFWLQYGKNLNKSWPFWRKLEDIRLDLNLAQKQQFQSHEQSAAGCSRSHLSTPEHHILPHPVRFQHTVEHNRKLPSWHKEQTRVSHRLWRDDTFLTRVWAHSQMLKRFPVAGKVLLLILLCNSAALLHPRSLYTFQTTFSKAGGLELRVTSLINGHHFQLSKKHLSLNYLCPHDFSFTVHFWNNTVPFFSTLLSL